MEHLELRKKWIEALRSGEYKQGIGELRSKDNCFCCLGVLCDIFNSNKWCYKKTYDYYDYNGYNAYVPVNIMEKVGLKSSKDLTLSRMNDIDHLSFEQIANELENNPDKYFEKE